MIYLIATCFCIHHTRTMSKHSHPRTGLMFLHSHLRYICPIAGHRLIRYLLLLHGLPVQNERPVHVDGTNIHLSDHHILYHVSIFNAIFHKMRSTSALCRCMNDLLSTNAPAPVHQHLLGPHLHQVVPTLPVHKNILLHPINITFPFSTYIPILKAPRFGNRLWHTPWTGSCLTSTPPWTTQLYLYFLFVPFTTI